MKTEKRCLTDYEMTNLILRSSKGNLKSKIVSDWISSSSKFYRESDSDEDFVQKTNKFLSKHKLPIKVIDIELVNEDEDDDFDEISFDWTIELSLTD